MNEAIGRFLSHEDEIVRHVATKVAELHTMKENGDLSDSEFKELCEDVVDLRKVLTMMDDSNRKQAVMDAINSISAVVGVVSKLI